MQSLTPPPPPYIHAWEAESRPVHSTHRKLFAVLLVLRSMLNDSLPPPPTCVGYIFFLFFFEKNTFFLLPSG